MTRYLLVGIAVALCGAAIGAQHASATTLTLGLDPGAADLGAPPDLDALKAKLAGCCDDANGTAAAVGNVGFDNTGSGNIGIGNSGSRNIGVRNGSTYNLGAFNGLGNASPTSGNGNIGVRNGNDNTSIGSGNGNVGYENGNGNESDYSGNGNIGRYNGNLNGVGSVGGTHDNGNGNIGAFNGNQNGVGNVGDDSGSYNGNGNAGAYNGNGNGSGNIGSLNGNWNGNGNVGAYNGNDNGNYNIGYASGNGNGNDNAGIDNGSGNGNGNTGAFNGNQNGNGNQGAHNGNHNGNGNVGSDNGNWNGNGNINGLDTAFGGRDARPDAAGATAFQPFSLTHLVPNPTASDGAAVDFGWFENTYDFKLNEASDLQYGGVSLGIADFNIALCLTSACAASDILDAGHAVHGLLSIAGGWDGNVAAGTYYLVVSGFAVPGGGAYFVGLIASPATTPLPPAAAMLVTALAMLAGVAIGRRRIQRA